MIWDVADEYERFDDVYEVEKVVDHKQDETTNKYIYKIIFNPNNAYKRIGSESVENLVWLRRNDKHSKDIPNLVLPI
ncbi:hypothetical protein [Absidia glauca]|uniref:Uncharacterized protein n=1 Tax=Absidia glauca TaxID=4829 RepID=A0A168N660_ABSGL|nr:hypothetical protein [Absidia glauca]